MHNALKENPVLEEQDVNNKPKNITVTERPKIAYEHPNLEMYVHLLKERLWRLKRKKSKYSINDDFIRSYFDQEKCLKKQCEFLSRYVIEAFTHYGVCDYALAYYPGRPSQQSARTDAIEGVSRVLPVLAAWMHHAKSTHIEGLNGSKIDCTHIIRSALLTGTNPNHEGYWGQLHDCDQRTCEAADLALTLWLSKKQVWNTLKSEQKTQIITWFKQVNTVITVDNNWHLFSLTVQAVIKALTGEDLIQHEKYERIKEFYVGEGWFRDGAKGNYDYYTAWGFHYSLYWIDQILPEFDPEFIRGSLSDFVQSYRYFFTSEGLPFFGRSACYRLAAPAPLLSAIHHDAHAIPISEVKRAMRTNLSYFISQGAMQYGAPTQGLFEDDTRLVDNYSGPASSFWSLRSLIIALYSGNKIGLWQAKESDLPIEKNNFAFDIKSINAHIRGNKATNEVVVLFNEDYTKNQSPISRRLEPQSFVNKVKETLLGRAERPKNNLLRKGVTCYSSKLGSFF